MVDMFTRTFVIPAWIMVFGLLFAFLPPTEMAATLYRLVGGGLIAPGIVVLLVARVRKYRHASTARRRLTGVAAQPWFQGRASSSLLPKVSPTLS